MNLGVLPRRRGCWVCTNIANPEDVTVRLIGPDGQPLKLADAMDYLTAIGHSATRRIWDKRLRSHRNHVLQQAEKGVMVTPAHAVAGKVTRTQPPGGDPTWLQAPSKAIDLGMEATEALAERLAAMEDKDLISLARLGITAAGKMGDWTAKGRQLGQVDRLMDLFYQSGHAETD